MTETQRRIKAYQKALPHLKERVTAVALLLAMSLAMMTSASFAWVTLSRSPEVSGLATTVSTNGNLEIALSKTDGSAPDESTVTDGAGSVVQSNLTWGNLINLSDPSYGLSDIILRPATLRTGNLSENPMSAVQYGSDGRITKSINDFRYSNYNGSVFAVGDENLYGVRAVSSVTYKDYEGGNFIIDQNDLITARRGEAESLFKGIYGNNEYMAAIAGLVGVYASVSLGDDAATSSCTAYYSDLVKMVTAFKSCMETAGNAIVEIANLYYYLGLDDAGRANYNQNKFVLADLITSSSTRYKDMTGYIQSKNMTSISEFRTAWTKTNSAYTGIVVNAKKTLDETGDVMWSDISSSVNALCDMNSATLKGKKVSEIKQMVKDLDIPGATGVLRDPPAVINGGAIWYADKLLGTKMNVPKNDTLKVVVNVPILGKTTVQPTSITTSAAEPFLIPTDAETAASVADSTGTNSKGKPTAAETYAMAIDIWVRTNSAHSLLILEGDVITKSMPVYDVDGNPVMVEKKDADGNIILDENDQPVLEQLYEDRVVGYEGVNRVWEELDDPLAGIIPDGAISTTQGSGSCYVFYPQSPEDQEQSLELLSAMHVAFVNSEGTKLATARMNTKLAVEDAGRIIVPLMLDLNDPVVVDDNGNTESYYIMPLVKNQAERITAIVYLDGTSLYNSDVLAAGSITGQLNLQFGTTDMELTAIDDEVKKEYFTISASVSTTAPSSDIEKQTTNSIEFTKSAKQWPAKVMLEIEGKQPTKVTASFVSVISASQGAKQSEFILVYSSETGKYEADVSFEGSGNYQLRSVQIDGVDYALTGDDIITVKIPGLSVQTLSWNYDSNSHTELTAESFYQLPVELILNNGTGTKPSVKGVFLGDNGQNINVDFTSEDGIKYTGSGKFTSSGTYTLTYVLINGVHTPLDTMQYKELNVKLGLQVEVFLTRPVLASGKIDKNSLDVMEPYDPAQGWRFVYRSNIDDPWQIGVVCYLYDDQGNPLEKIDYIPTLCYGVGNGDNSLRATLTWNENGYYTGAFQNYTNGTYAFQYMKTGDTSYVTNAISAPSVNSISPAPMEYIGWSEEKSQSLMFDLSNKSEHAIYMELAEAKSAKLTAVLKNETVVGEPERTVEGAFVESYTDKTGREVSIFKFVLPNDAKDGQWTIVSARASQVVYNDVFYSGLTEDDYLDLNPFLNAAEKKLTTNFITKVFLSVNSATAAANNGAFSLNCGFMEETLTVNDIVLTFTTQDGKPINYWAQQAGFNNLKVEVNGEYSWAKNVADNNLTSRNILVEGSSQLATDGKYKIPEMRFSVDGKYTCLEELTVTLMDADTGTELFRRTNVTLPNVTVTWSAPTVNITAIDPTSTINTEQGSKTPEFNAKSATVYVTKNSSICGANYDEPSVTLRIAGYGSATGAKVEFSTTKDKVGLYTRQGYNNSQTDYYEWTDPSANQDCERWVGYDKSAPAGTIKAEGIILIMDGIEYTFALAEADVITINNPC